MTTTSPFDSGRRLPANADALMQELRGALEPSEKPLWSGFPVQGVRLTAQDAFLIPFSVLWGGFAIFWETQVMRSNAPFFFMLWGIPFVAIGLYMIAGRFFADAAVRARTVYAVTNRRAVILYGLFSRNLRSLELFSLGEINSSEKPDGSGTITFGAVNPFTTMRGWPGMNRANTSPAFEGIARVREVLGIIRDAQRDASRGTDS
jgi:hypothetical protein